MDVHVSDHAPRFADRVAKMLERVEHRPAIRQPTAKRLIGFGMKPI
jgi:hypothetical protein